MIPFSFWGFMVCAFTLICLFYTQNEVVFTFSMILLLLSVVWARYFYFKSLRKLLQAKRIDQIYKYMVYFYSAATVYFLFDSLGSGFETMFDTSQPTQSPSSIRNALIPYALHKHIKLIIAPNYLFCQLGFIYMAYSSFKRKEYIITFGSIFTMLAILYTNSYHLLKLKYWIPLNVVADVFELLRLNFVQKKNIKRAFKETTKKIEDLELKNLELESINLESKVFKHDLANKFLSSYMNLKKAKKIAQKNVPNKELIKSISKALVAQEMATDYFHGNDKVGTIDIAKFIENLNYLIDINVILDETSVKEITFNKKDFTSIVVNLVKNAKEANQRNEKAWVRLIIKEGEEDYHFWIIDCGKFEDIRNKEKIFDKGISTKGENRGLGLFSVKSLVEKHSGSIKLIPYSSHTCFKLEIKKSSLTLS